jgi:uncharacterized RDD family membrane protein YckC
VLIACAKCGAANDEHAQACYVCDAPYDHPDEEVLVREAASPSARAAVRRHDPEPELRAVFVPELEPDPEPELVPAPKYVPPRVRETSHKLLPEAEPADSLAAAPREPASSLQPEWRREVVHRLEAYRARRRRNGRSENQTELPFNGNGDNGHDDPEYRASLRRASRSGPVAGVAAVDAAENGSAEGKRAARTERIEIPVMQPEFSFVLAPGDEEEEIHPHAPLVPVAEVRERCRAGLLDATFLALSYAGFLILFRALGGHLSIGKQEAIVYVTTFFLFYAIYFGLFTALGGTTPGMYFRGLTVVSFDGTLPAMRQLLWRSFGYALSGGTLMLGFLWSLWDEDHLTWQDRISQTYLTQAASAMWRDLSGEDPAPLPSTPHDPSLPDAT